MCGQVPPEKALDYVADLLALSGSHTAYTCAVDMCDSKGAYTCRNCNQQVCGLHGVDKTTIGHDINPRQWMTCVCPLCRAKANHPTNHRR